MKHRRQSHCCDAQIEEIDRNYQINGVHFRSWHSGKRRRGSAAGGLRRPILIGQPTHEYRVIAVVICAAARRLEFASSSQLDIIINILIGSQQVDGEADACDSRGS